MTSVPDRFPAFARKLSHDAPTGPQGFIESADLSVGLKETSATAALRHCPKFLIMNLRSNYTCIRRWQASVSRLSGYSKICPLNNSIAYIQFRQNQYGFIISKGTCQAACFGCSAELFYSLLNSYSLGRKFFERRLGKLQVYATASCRQAESVVLSLHASPVDFR